MGTRRPSPVAANGHAMAPPTTASCRACWRMLSLVPQDALLPLLRLPCGDMLCANCLGALARAALAAPPSLVHALPLRCCHAVVPAALLRRVLAPPELAFYAFQTQQRVAATRARVTHDGLVLTTPCDFCLVPVALTTPQHAQELLLPCGHVYCRDCLATMTQSAGTRPVCCEELIGGAATGGLALPTAPQAHATAAAALAMLEAPPPADQPVVRTVRRVSARRAAAPAPFAAAAAATPYQGKGKRKLQTPPATDTNVVDLLDDSDDDDDDDGHNHDDDAVRAQRRGLQDDDDEGEVCIKCAARVDAATNRFRAACGHVFCRTCLHDRCLRALRNEEQGSIGIPVRCCHALVTLELLQAVLSKRNFVKYEALVAKRGDAAIPAPPRVTRKRKQDTVPAVALDAAAAGGAGNRKKPRTQQAATTNENPDAAPAECVACMATVDDAKNRFTGPCGHVYCVTCLTMMAKQSLENRALVPIRCCSQEFPIDYVKRVLHHAQFAQYDRFLKEKDWRTSDLKSDKEYAAMVKAINGKQCPTCGVGVQKISGCDAIRCLRGHLFCFACEAAPCTCGRTRLENYGWVPPGTEPPNGVGVGVARGVAGGGVMVRGFADVMAAANARAAGLLAQAMERARAGMVGADAGAAARMQAAAEAAAARGRARERAAAADVAAAMARARVNAARADVAAAMAAARAAAPRPKAARPKR